MKRKNRRREVVTLVISDLRTRGILKKKKELKNLIVWTCDVLGGYIFGVHFVSHILDGGVYTTYATSTLIGGNSFTS